MDFKFNSSLPIISQLAHEAIQIPPSQNQPPFEYIDQSLIILGRTFDSHDQRIREEFLSQRQFIASEFRKVEKNVDKRFKEVQKKMDGRFEKVENKMDRRFEDVEKKMDRRFDEVEKKMDRRFEEVEKKMVEQLKEQESAIQDTIKVHFENALAMGKNGRLTRMNLPIYPIKVYKPAGVPDKFIWASHPYMPKNLKNVYFLGQRAKGIFEHDWEGKPKEPTYTQRQALHTIEELLNFHNIILQTDHDSDSDSTQILVQEGNVDDYMEVLLSEWGMDWQKIVQLWIEQSKARPQQVGVKRGGDSSSKGEKKKHK